MTKPIKKLADAAPAVVQPVTITPTMVFTVRQLQSLLGLRASTVRREVRLGRLRVAKRAGRYFVLGEWVLDWLRGGEVSRRQPSATTI